MTTVDLRYVPLFAPSVLDAERLMRRHRSEIQRFLSEWLGTEEKTEGDAA